MRNLFLSVFFLSLSGLAFAQEGSSAPPVFPKNKFSGDFRYRLQSELDGDDDERLTNKLRIRLGLSSELSELTSLNFRLTSFSKPDSSQASGNFNMGDSTGYGFQRRLIGIDQAYVDYHPWETLKVQLGKVPMGLSFAGKSQLVLDADLGLEGVAAYSKWTINETVEAYLNLGYFVVAENYSATSPKVDETDNVIYAPQVGAKVHLESWTLQAMLSKVSFAGLKDDPFSHTCCANGASAKGRGNTEGALSGTFLYDYDITEYGLEAKTKIESYELSLFAQSFINTAVKAKNKGSWVGFTLAEGPYSVLYGQGRTEADAVVAAFTDADLAKGESDSRGQQLSLLYKVTPYWQLSLTKYDSEYRQSISAIRYRRLGLDSQWSF